MKRIYLFIDGMSESKGEITTLGKAKTPTIDKLFNNSNHYGFYTPEKAYFNSEPKTDVVIPAFFGLKQEINPGRAALEIIDIGHELASNSICFALTTNLSINLYKPEFVADLRSYLGTNVIISNSNATNTGEKILFGNLKIHQVKTVYHLISNHFNENTNFLKIIDFGFVCDEFIAMKNSRKNCYFLGWAKGALRGALKHLGFETNPFDRKKDDYFNWDAYVQNFNDWIIPQLSKRKNLIDTFVFYTKETAFACRQNNQKEKVKAIEIMDSFLSKILKQFDEEVLTIILADHSSNFGETDNPTDRTIFVIAQSQSLVIPKADSHFHENNVTIMNKPIIKQSALINSIDIGAIYKL